MGGLGSCGTLAKILLVIINFLVWIGGSVLLGVGLYFKITGKGLDYFEIINIAGDDPLWDVALWVIIALGGLLFLIGFLGCCGAFTENATMLLIYAILVIIILLVEITAGILAVVFREKVEDFLKTGMLNQVQESYRDETDQDALTQAWNALQVEFACCGVDDYTDWWGSMFDISKNITSSDQLYQRVPISCCIMVEADVNNPVPVNITYCIQEAFGDITSEVDARALNTAGCYDQLLNWIDQRSIILIGVAFGVAVLEIIVIVSACGVRRKVQVNQGIVY